MQRPIPAATRPDPAAPAAHYDWRAQLEPALVARYLLDPSLLDGWRRLRLSTAARCVLATIDDDREHNLAGVRADLPSRVALFAYWWALARGLKDPRGIVRPAVRLAARAAQLTIQEFAFLGSPEALLQLLGAERRPAFEEPRAKRPAQWERALALAADTAPETPCDEGRAA